MKVKHIMFKPVVMAKADITIRSAIKSLYEKHVGSIVVTDNDGHCKGIFTERDAIRVIATDISQDISLEMAMSKKPYNDTVRSLVCGGEVASRARNPTLFLLTP